MMKASTRVANAVRGGPTDRIPVFPSMISAAISLQHRDQGLYSTDGKYLAETLLRNREMFDYDGIYVSSDNWIMYSGLGGTVHFPVDGEPIGTEILCKDLADYRKLRVPDPTSAGRMPLLLEAAGRVMERAGGDYFVLANIDSAPFQLAGILRGLQQLMYDVSDNGPMLHEVLKRCTEVAIRFGIAMREKAGVPAIQFGDSMAGLIRREQYEEFCFPYECQVIHALKETGVMVFLHVCGDSRHILDLMARSGADCLEIDEAVDLATALKVADGSVCIRGNLRTTLFLDGTKEEVLRQARNCVRLGEGKRYILSAGCGIPRLARIESLAALREAVEKPW